MITIGSKKDVRQVILATSIIVSIGSVFAFVGSILVVSQGYQKNLEIANNLESIKTKEILNLKTEEQISQARSDSGIAAKTNTLIIPGISKATLFKESKNHLAEIKSFKDGLLLNITDENRTIIGTFDGSYVCQSNTKTCLKTE